MAEDTTIYDDAYYLELGKKAAAAKAAEVPPVPTEAPVAPLTFGPMAPVAPKPVPLMPVPLTQGEQEDALIARILAAIQAGGSASAAPTTTPPKPVSKEDQRVLDEMSRLFPTGRDTAVASRVNLGNNLFLVEVGYTPHSGVRYSEKVLILDNGKDPIVVWRAD